MKKIIAPISCLFLILMSCTQTDATFLITENSVGPLLKTSAIADLETLFAQDSIVKDTSDLKVGNSTKKIKIFEKGGKQLLLLTPNTDSIPTTENIRIMDDRYMTSKGIGLKSTFQEIQDEYAINKIVTTLNSVVIFPKASNLYFTIDKDQLPSNLKYTTSSIEAVQIPGTAKIKYLMLGWE
ncbi:MULTISPECIES: hypothetical protein [Flavobacteriaceae]|uniref:hypothetical protein n=1 Tax=Flavobacteriaceae TaxID=49546 RepID=UPI0014930E7C|nr:MULTISPECIES: hypothetical protein [Allomuricauda]MDC6366639.1 hypothetical protein [Muricauda sp. AC10]